MSDAMKALRRVDFDWTAHIDQIWSDGLGDVEQLQKEVRGELDEHLEDLVDSARTHSPLGVTLLGAAGSGKTHLLGVVRGQAVARKAFFVLVDMTDVKDFWETVLLGYLRSLQQPGHDGRRQLDSWLSAMIAAYGAKIKKAKGIPQQRPPGLINTCNAFVAAVGLRHPGPAREHADVLRALLLFACDHADINDLGYKWLQGLGIDEEERSHHGFRQAQQQPSHIVRGLSWLLSLEAPTVLCLDQLDAIVAEHNLAASEGEEASEQSRASLAIIQGIAGGLMALRDVTLRTLTIVSTLQVTWEILARRSTASVTDRFEAPLHLDAANPAEAVRSLVQLRLDRGYGSVGYEPPYPTFPFAESFLEKYRSNTPREVLKACDAHRRACRKAGAVSEATGDGGAVLAPPPSPSDWEPIRARFQELEQKASVELLLADDTERAFDVIVEAACYALIVENPLPDVIKPQLDRDFLATGPYDPLHARIRLLLTHQAERERHHSFRFLQRQHHSAFQARLKAAITASGIDRSLGFRRLTILRMGPVPGGPASVRLVKELAAQGGQLVEPSEAEVKSLWALSQLLQPGERPEGLEAWLEEDRPVSQLPCFRQAATWLFDDLRAPPRPGESPASDLPREASLDATPAPARAPAAAPLPVSRVTPDAQQPRAPGPVLGAPVPPSPPVASRSEIPIGRLAAPGAGAEPLSIGLSSLKQHVCVLAGSGSGKTVFLRRIVEEAALVGVPSIVIDGANDLSRLGDPWPERPRSFSEVDAEKARRYAERVEVIVWTPGKATGNPLHFDPLPDFEVLAASGSPEEVEEQRSLAVAMARASLEPLVAPSNSARDKKAKAILAAALGQFAKRPGRSIKGLIASLREPDEAIIEGYRDGEKIAQGLAELLLSAVQTDPLLGAGGAPLDPGRLLRSARADQTRVSVINLSGLPGLEAQQRFVNQLAMTLFSWIKKHPARDGALTGLLLLDEAKDFVPSGRSVPCRENLVRLAAQARKYGLGMLFATQAPKSIDHNVVANCSTLLVGRMNSPAAIDTVQELLRNKGGAGSDVATLPRGTFYASTVAHPRPAKIVAPLCLSHHPSSPPDEDEVTARARAARALS